MIEIFTISFIIIYIYYCLLKQNNNIYKLNEEIQNLQNKNEIIEKHLNKISNILHIVTNSIETLKNTNDSLFLQLNKKKFKW